MEFLTKIFDWLAGLSAKLPTVEVKPFFICALVAILAVGVAVGLTYFSSKASKLKRASKKITKCLSLLDEINDDNVADFTEQCFSSKAPKALRDTWVEYIGVRFGYPSDIVSTESVFDKEVKKVGNCRANIFAGVSLLILAVFAFVGFGTLGGVEMSVIHSCGLVLIGIEFLTLLIVGRVQHKKSREAFYAMQEDLDAKVNFQVEKHYATDASPLTELAAMIDAIISRNTAKLIELSEKLQDSEQDSDAYLNEYAKLAEDVSDDTLQKIKDAVSESTAKSGPVALENNAACKTGIVKKIVPSDILTDAVAEPVAEAEIIAKPTATEQTALKAEVPEQTAAKTEVLEQAVAEAAVKESVTKPVIYEAIAETGLFSEEIVDEPIAATEMISETAVDEPSAWNGIVDKTEIDRDAIKKKEKNEIEAETAILTAPISVVETETAQDKTEILSDNEIISEENEDFENEIVPEENVVFENEIVSEENVVFENEKLAEEGASENLVATGDAANILDADSQDAEGADYFETVGYTDATCCDDTTTNEKPITNQDIYSIDEPPSENADENIAADEDTLLETAGDDDLVGNENLNKDGIVMFGNFNKASRNEANAAQNVERKDYIPGELADADYYESEVITDEAVYDGYCESKIIDNDADDFVDGEVVSEETVAKTNAEDTVVEETVAETIEEETEKEGYCEAELIEDEYIYEGYIGEMPIVTEPIADEISYAPVAEEFEEYPMAEEIVEEPIADDAVFEPIAQEIAYTPVAEEIEDEPIAEETVFEPIAEEVKYVAVAEEIIEEPIVEDAVDEPIAEETTEEPMAEVIEEEQIVEEAVAEPIAEEPIAEPLVAEVGNPAKLSKLPELLAFMLAKPLSRGQKIKIATLVLTAYNAFKNVPAEKPIVMKCIMMVLPTLR